MVTHTHIHTHIHTHTTTTITLAVEKAPRVNYYKLFEALKLVRFAHALRVSKHVTESIRNIARAVGIN